MGRRALRKLDPSLDLSANFKVFDQLPSPWDAAELFGRVASVEVEVGTGKGLFLRNAAAEHPQVDFMGIEISNKYAHFAAAALAKRGLCNAVVIATDAFRVFDELLPDHSIAAVHIYFPDPWWKKRHKKRRVMNASFLHQVTRVLRPGGSLHFWTDVQEYFDVSRELISACTTLDGPLEVPELPAEHDMAYRTHYERRTRQQEEPVYRAEYRKPASGEPHHQISGENGQPPS